MSSPVEDVRVALARKALADSRAAVDTGRGAGHTAIEMWGVLEQQLAQLLALIDGDVPDIAPVPALPDQTTADQPAPASAEGVAPATPATSGETAVAAQSEALADPADQAGLADQVAEPAPAAAPYEPGQLVIARRADACCPDCGSADLEFRFPYEDEPAAFGVFRCVDEEHNGARWMRSYDDVMPVIPTAFSSPDGPADQRAGDYRIARARELLAASQQARANPGKANAARWWGRLDEGVRGLVAAIGERPAGDGDSAAGDER